MWEIYVPVLTSRIKKKISLVLLHWFLTVHWESDNVKGVQCCGVLFSRTTNKKGKPLLYEYLLHVSCLLKRTWSAVMTGVSLGLLKSTEAAQKGTKKKGVFLQKAGRILDAYLPGKIGTRSIKTALKNTNDLTNYNVHEGGSNQRPLRGWEQFDGRWRTPPTAAPGYDRTACMEEKINRFHQMSHWTHSRRGVVMVLMPQFTLWTCGGS